MNYPYLPCVLHALTISYVVPPKSASLKELGNPCEIGSVNTVTWSNGKLLEYGVQSIQNFYIHRTTQK
jgi:hypothetical protein